MKNTIKTLGIIAFVAIIGLGFFASCEEDAGYNLEVKVTSISSEQTVIKITDIPSQHNGKYATVGISNSDSNKTVGLNLPKAISNGTVECEIIEATGGNKMVSIIGVGSVVLIISEDNQVKNDIYNGLALNVSMDKGLVPVAFSKFYEVK
jgi:hypothetical protein